MRYSAGWVHGGIGGGHRGPKRVRPALVAAGILLAAAQAEARPLDTATWLVDLGRDYPRTAQAGLSNADAEITLLLMQAASRINPGMASAYLWQYDMLSALGRDDAARDVLGRYVEREPSDLSAHVNWIAMQFDLLQTAERRAEFCRTQLRRPNLPGPVVGDLHRRLAEIHHNRGETDKTIAEARAALTANELNFEARRLLDAVQTELRPSRAREAAELDLLLCELAASPGDTDRAWRAADELMLQNLPEPADRLYAHAGAVLQIFDPRGNLPAVLTARILSLRALGKTADANAQIPMAGDAWQRLLERMQGSPDAEWMAEMAWFYTHFGDKPADAEKLAHMAVLQDPELVVARRAWGAALRILGRTEEATEALGKVADQDAVAAAEYAQMLWASGNPQKARQLLAEATTRPADPLSVSVLAEARGKLGVAPTASAPAPAEVRQAVSRFPWAVLDYPRHPDKYISLVIEMPRHQMTPGEPWPVTVRLRNTGSFNITVGDGMMVRPDLLVSVDTMGDKPRTTGPTLHLLFNKTAVLAAGQTAELSSTVELGAIRAGLIGTPQMTQDVLVNAILSPVLLTNDQGQDVWNADIGGLKAEPLRFRRVPFLPDEQNMADLHRRLRSSDPLERIAAMELFAMLLAESQHIAAGRLQYTARLIDVAAVQRAILSCVDDPDWQVRSRLAECLRWFELNPEVTNAAARLLNDSHWLVRGLCMRALADHYAAKFQTVLTKASQVDADEWVRRLASALNARIIAATSQPASQPAEPR